MILGDRLRALREEKHFSQGDVQERTGLLRCYVSRVENGYTVPSLDTLERLARALEVPLYQLFCDGEQTPNVPIWSDDKEVVWGMTGYSARKLQKLRRSLQEMRAGDRKFLLAVALRMASRNRRNR